MQKRSLAMTGRFKSNLTLLKLGLIEVACYLDYNVTKRHLAATSGQFELNLMLLLRGSDRGQVLTKLPRYSKAINSCERAIKLKSDYELAWLNRGIALEKMHCFKEAFDSSEKILKIKPDI